MSYGSHDMMIDNLTPHFSLRELTRTSHRTADNIPHTDVVDRLRILCERCLEPLRSHFGPLFVTSGYRCPEVNASVGGAKQSAHLFGCAADLVPLADGVTTEEMIAWVATSSLPFDQVIVEHSSTGDWLHIGMARPGYEERPRKQVLRFRDGIYYPWVPPTAHIT